MRNFAGQEVNRGDFVGQVARTNQGMKKRVGIVLGYGALQDDKTGYRIAWYEPESGHYELTETTVPVDYIFKLDPGTLPATPVQVLRWALQRGHA